MEMKYKLNANFHTLTVCLSVISIAANYVTTNHEDTYYYNNAFKSESESKLNGNKVRMKVHFA